MNFRTIFILNRIVTPIAVALIGASLLLPDGPAKRAVQVAIGVPFAAICLYGARLGVRLKRNYYVPMRCPLCERTGDAGRGLTREVGWWFRCDTCGILKPQGLLGLSFSKQPVADDDDDT